MDDHHGCATGNHDSRVFRLEWASLFDTEKLLGKQVMMVVVVVTMVVAMMVMMVVAIVVVLMVKKI